MTESFGVRRLIADNYTQSRSLNKNYLTGAYWDGFIRNIPPLDHRSRVLILGFGGGTIAKLLTKHQGLVQIDAVEIDPLMVDLGKKYLDLAESNVNIIIADAIKWVKDARFKYDLICVDLFANGKVAVGSEERKFFESVKKLLKAKGVVAINKLFINDHDLERYVAYLETVFHHCDMLVVRGTFRTDNIVIYCRN